MTRPRTATRHGSEDGSVTLGGRRVPVRRPRMRAVDGSGELPVPSYELFTGTEMLGGMAMERMLAGLATRRYPVGLEPVGEQVEAASRSTWKSAVSWRFVKTTETALSELLAADLSQLMSMPRATTQHDCPKCTPSTMSAARASTGSSTRCRWWRARRNTGAAVGGENDLDGGTTSPPGLHPVLSLAQAEVGGGGFTWRGLGPVRGRR